MDKSKVVDCVEANLEELKKLFGLERWRISIYYEPLRPHADGFRPTMQVDDRVEYEMAAITIDCASLDDEEEVIRFLKHELMHLLHAPFGLFWNAFGSDSNHPSRQSMEAVWKHAQELTVLNIERFHEAHKKYFEAKLNAKPKAK